MRYLLFIALSVTVLVGCQNPTQNDSSRGTESGQKGKVMIVADSTVEGAVQEFISVVWCKEGISTAYVTRAKALYRYENCDEVQETLEVVEVRSEPKISAAFIRFSVGTDVFRKVLWFEEAEGRYVRTYDYYSKASDGLDDEADQWEEESAEWGES